MVSGFTYLDSIGSITPPCFDWAVVFAEMKSPSSVILFFSGFILDIYFSCSDSEDDSDDDFTFYSFFSFNCLFFLSCLSFLSVSLEELISSMLELSLSLLLAFDFLLRLFNLSADL